MLPKAVDPWDRRSTRVLLALALGALSTLVVLAAWAGLARAGGLDQLLVVLFVLGCAGCSVSVRLAVRTALRP